MGKQREMDGELLRTFLDKVVKEYVLPGVRAEILEVVRKYDHEGVVGATRINSLEIERLARLIGQLSADIREIKEGIGRELLNMAREERETPRT